MAHGFLPTVTLSTQIQGLSHTLIKNIFSKILSNDNTTVILSNQVSDQATFICTKDELLESKLK